MAITNAQQYQQLVKKPSGSERPGYRGGKDQGKDSKGAGAGTVGGTGRGMGPAGGASSGGNYGGNTNNQSDSRNQGPAGGASAGGDYGGNVRADQTYAGREFRDQPFASDDSIQRAEDNLRRIQNNETKLENRDLFINKPGNYGKYVPPVAQFLANFNRKPNRRFFYERVLKNNAQGLNYTELEKAYQEYMQGRMSGETDAMGRTIIPSGRDDQPIIPIIPQDPLTMDQATEELIEEEEPFQLARAFRADGGIMGGLADGQIDEMGRQMYGLGKLVKKATRAVKKIAKSPIGKAALLYTGAGALGNLAGGSGLAGMFKGFTSPSTFLSGSKLGGIFSREGLTNILLGGGSGANKFSGLVGTGGTFSPFKAFAGLTALTALTPAQEKQAQLLADETGIDINDARNQILQAAAGQQDDRARAFKAGGGIMRLGYQEGGDAEPVAKKTMPLLDMGGKEKDYRETGGFVDMGRMERADDVPARLSKNEFVFTADAVRNAGDGDIDKGAEVMYNMMKNLEAGGEVSEESQGLEGARKMFQTSQRLEEVL